MLLYEEHGEGLSPPVPDGVFPMSATLPSHRQMRIATYERMLAETRKFAAEQNKLAAEAAKLKWDRLFAPAVIASSFLSAMLGAGGVALIQWIIRSRGLS